MADIWSVMPSREFGTAEAARLTAGYRRRAVRFVAGSARDAGDAALILEALGLTASEGREETAA